MEFCMSLSFLNQRIIQFVIAPGIAMCNRKEVLFCCTTHCFSLLALIAFILLIKRNPDGQRRWFPCRHINSIRVYWLLSGIPAPCQGCGVRHNSPSNLILQSQRLNKPARQTFRHMSHHPSPPHSPGNLHHQNDRNSHTREVRQSLRRPHRGF